VSRVAQRCGMVLWHVISHKINVTDTGAKTPFV